MNVEHIKDYDSAMKVLGVLTRWEINLRAKKDPSQTRDYPYPANEKWWVNDLECPY
jgi:hypothetical protein